MNFFQINSGMIFNLDVIVRVINHKDDNSNDICTMIFSDGSRLTLFAESLQTYHSSEIDKKLTLFDNFVNVFNNEVMGRRPKEKAKHTSWHTNITIINVLEKDYQFSNY